MSQATAPAYGAPLAQASYGPNQPSHQGYHGQQALGPPQQGNYGQQSSGPPQQGYASYGQPTPAGAQLQQQAYVYTPPRVVYNKYSAGQSRGLGVAQIVMGVLCIGCNSGAILVASVPAFMGSGIWSGLLFIITGSIGVCASKTKTRCKVVAYMVLCIISSVFCLFVFQMGLGGALTGSYPIYGCSDSYSSKYGSGSRTCGHYAVARVVFCSMLAVLAVMEGIAFIWGSALCCKVACCCSPSPNQQVVVGAQYVPLQTQFVGSQQCATAPPMTMTYPATAYPGYQVGGISAQWSPEGAVGGAPPFAAQHAPSASGDAFAPPMYTALPPPYNEDKVAMP